MTEELRVRVSPSASLTVLISKFSIAMKCMRSLFDFLTMRVTYFSCSISLLEMMEIWIISIFS